MEEPRLLQMRGMGRAGDHRKPGLRQTLPERLDLRYMDTLAEAPKRRALAGPGATGRPP